MQQEEEEYLRAVLARCVPAQGSAQWLGTSTRERTAGYTAPGTVTTQWVA